VPVSATRLIIARRRSGFYTTTIAERHFSGNAVNRDLQFFFTAVLTALAETGDAIPHIISIRFRESYALAADAA
jgi:hypothetical protein